MTAQSVVVLFDESVAQGPDGLPDIGLALLEWARIGGMTAVRIERGEFDSTLRLMAGYVVDSERPENERRMPAGTGPWRWDCYSESFEFAAGAGWPPADSGGLPEF